MSIPTKPLVGILVLLSVQAAEDPMALVQRAYQLQQSGDYASAADAYRAFSKLRPGEVGAHSNLGVVLTKLGRYDEAIQEYEAADKLLPGDSRIVVNLALAYEKSGRLPEALNRLQSLPLDRQISMLLADAYLQTGENSRVIQLLQPLEQQTPDDLAVAYLLGTALIRQQRTNEGQVLLDRILKNGDTAEARFLLGMQMYEWGDYPASVKQFAAAAEVNPKLPELQAYYGQALLTTGDPDAAVAAFSLELENNPNNFAANLGLGQILTVRKHLVEAEPLLKKALLARPQSAEASLAIGTCLSRQGKIAEARPYLQAAAKAMPASAEEHREGQLAQLAPDFTLPEVTTAKNVSLHDFHGRSPVVLIFGSYTCPNFRDSAAALKTLQSKYGDKALFFLIYIREAHSHGDWQSTRNQRADIHLPEATSLSEKKDHAAMCSRTLHLPFPALLDGLDNKVEAAYSAWPSRALVIDRAGRIRYSTRLTELDFLPTDMEAALKKAITIR